MPFHLPSPYPQLKAKEAAAEAEEEETGEESTEVRGVGWGRMAARACDHMWPSCMWAIFPSHLACVHTHAHAHTHTHKHTRARAHTHTCALAQSAPTPWIVRAGAAHIHVALLCAGLDHGRQQHGG